MDSQLHRDTHFLQRSAERLDRPEAEFALALWQNPKLLAQVLKLLQLPETCERVALGLGIDRDGPWLVVTRDGHFVTCLGEGMAPTGLLAVPATKVATLTARAQHALAEEAFVDNRVTDLSGPNYGVRLVRASPWVSREDFRVYTAWSPAMAPTYLRTFASSLESLQIMACSGRRPKYLDRKSGDDLARLHWQVHWSLLLTVMLCIEVPVVREQPEYMLKMINAIAALRQLGGTLRAVWMLGHIGKPMIGLLKKQFRDETEPTKQLTAHLGLATIALRHKSTRAEIEKVLLSTGRPTLPSPLGQQMDVALLGSAQRLLHESESIGDQFVQLGAGLLIQHAKTLPQDRQSAILADPALVLRAAGPLLCMTTGSFVTSSTAQHVATLAPPWLAKQDAADLFLPDAQLQLLRDPYDPVTARVLCEACLGPRGGPPVVRAGPQLSRNDLCHCGSQRKYKHCCLNKRGGEM